MRFILQVRRELTLPLFIQILTSFAQR